MYKQLIYPYIRAAFILLCIIFSFVLFKYLFMPLLPFFLAILFSYAINPAVTLLEDRLKFPRPLAVLIILLFLFSIVIGIVILVIAEILQGTSYLAENIPDAYQAFISWLEKFIHTVILPLYNNLISLFHRLDPSYQAAITENIEQYTTQLADTGTALLKGVFLEVPAILALLPNSITTFLFTVLATFFLSNDWQRIKTFMTNHLPSRLHHNTNEVIWHLKKALTGYVRAQLILMLTTFLIVFTGLAILQVKHFLTISLIAVALDLLPYIGTGVIFLPWIFYLFLTGEHSLTVGLCMLYMLIIIVRQVIEPKVLSGSIGLNPLAALIALFAGIKLWGAAGVLIAPLALLIASAVHQAGITHKLWSFIKG
ncbi:sporulation integral membrane protein YtvI [Virgibacillus sediminis]|uniref:Sporulation integral membrane protein YtvI n=1 Tax=Virgibacillus sediminis TaxID=202260 RepID=A0ABV7A6X0_9BACI